MRQWPESDRQKIDKSIRVNVCLKQAHAVYRSSPLTAEWALRALIYFTLSNARRFYSSMGEPLSSERANEDEVVKSLLT